jgi:hypothetical protein
MIFGDLAYLAIGFTTTFLALDIARHFIACKIKDKTTVLYVKS